MNEKTCPACKCTVPSSYFECNCGKCFLCCPHNDPQDRDDDDDICGICGNADCDSESDGSSCEYTDDDGNTGDTKHWWLDEDDDEDEDFEPDADSEMFCDWSEDDNDDESDLIPDNEAQELAALVREQNARVRYVAEVTARKEYALDRAKYHDVFPLVLNGMTVSRPQRMMLVKNVSPLLITDACTIIDCHRGSPAGVVMAVSAWDNYGLDLSGNYWSRLRYVVDQAKAKRFETIWFQPCTPRLLCTTERALNMEQSGLLANVTDVLPRVMHVIQMFYVPEVDLKDPLESQFIVGVDEWATHAKPEGSIESDAFNEVMHAGQQLGATHVRFVMYGELA